MFDLIRNLLNRPAYAVAHWTGDDPCPNELEKQDLPTIGAMRDHLRAIDPMSVDGSECNMVDLIGGPYDGSQFPVPVEMDHLHCNELFIPTTWDKRCSAVYCRKQGDSEAYFRGINEGEFPE